MMAAFYKLDKKKNKEKKAQKEIHLEREKYVEKSGIF